MAGDTTAFAIGNAVACLSAGTAILVGDPGSGAQLQFEICNPTAAAVAVAYNPLAATANTNAAVPTAGNLSATGVTVLGAGVTKVVTAAPGMYWGTSASGVFVQSGSGI